MARDRRGGEAPGRGAALLLELGRLRARAGARALRQAHRCCRSTSAGSSSSAAARRRSSRRSRSRASTTACAGSRRARSSSRAGAPTTGRRSGRSPSTGARPCARSSSRCSQAASAPMPYRYRCPYCAEKAGRPSAPTRSTGSSRTRALETVAAVILEPVQNSGGSIVPPEGTSTAFGRSATRRAPARRRRGSRCAGRRRLVRPDPRRSALTDDAGRGSPRPAPRARWSRPRRRSSPSSPSRRTFTHGTSALPARLRDRAREHRDLRAQEGLIERVLGPSCAPAASSSWRPSDGRRRGGDGYFYSPELVKDKETKETFAPAERDQLIKGFDPRMRELGVYTRFDDRAETCAQFARLRRRPGGVRRDGGRPAPGARRGLGSHQRHGKEEVRWQSRDAAELHRGRLGRRHGRRAREIVSPVTGEKLAEAPNASEEDVARAARAARRRSRSGRRSRPGSGPRSVTRSPT